MVYGIAGIIAVTVLASLGVVDGAVAIPFITLVVGGGFGHANGFRQGEQNGNGH